MAITTQDIHAAADKLQAEGQQPTLAAVRAALGGGSFTTISEAMKQWKAAQQQTAAPIREAAPAAVAERMAEVAGEVWSIAQSMANDRLTSEREALDAARVEMEQAQAEAAELADQLAADLDAAKAQIEQDSDALKSAQAEIADEKRWRLEIEREMERVRNEAVQDIEASRAALAESKKRADELAAMLNQERAERITAEQGRAAAEQTAAVLTARLDAAERRASDAEAREQVAQAKAEQAESLTALARQAEQSARVAEQAAQARLESAGREIEQAKTSAAEARAEAKAAGEAAAELRGRLASAEQQPK